MQSQCAPGQKCAHSKEQTKNREIQEIKWIEAVFLHPIQSYLNTACSRWEEMIKTDMRKLNYGPHAVRLVASAWVYSHTASFKQRAARAHTKNDLHHSSSISDDGNAITIHMSITWVLPIQIRQNSICCTGLFRYTKGEKRERKKSERM